MTNAQLPAENTGGSAAQPNYGADSTEQTEQTDTLNKTDDTDKTENTERTEVTGTAEITGTADTTAGTDSTASTEVPAATEAVSSELPDRVRVHALAKLLSVTSREVLAELTRLGQPARSPQSSVPKDLAVKVADALGRRDGLGEALGTGDTEDTAGADPAPKPDHGQAATPSAAHVPVFAAPSPVFLPPTPLGRPVRKEEPEPEPEPEAEAEIEAPDPTVDDVDDEAGDADGGARRRRRRGRRGRGRGKGGDEPGSDEQGTQDGGAEADDTADDTADAESSDSGDAESGESTVSFSEGASRRRRRRRRRKGGDDDAADAGGEDPPNTVVHVREGRDKDSKDTKDAKSDGRDTKSDGKGDSRDGVRSVRGSTRLEAKRQRRRDGREAGRRRAPILSEAEFLARRESVERTMVVAERGESTQIGVLEDGVLVEHFVTTSGSGSIVGNVYLGRVQNVLPSMEAAFIDIGRGRNAVLYAGEVDWDAAGLEGKARKIEQALATGDNVLVQVTKDPVGHKGARLTTQISLPGRFLVYVPAGGATGISRKLPENERRRLKEILKRIVPEDAGVIIRTASEGISEDELERDVRRLKAQWEVIKDKAESAGSQGKRSGAPVLLYEEPDLLVKVVRDLFTEDFKSLEIQGDTAWETIHAYVEHVAPDLEQRLRRYVGTGDVFADHRVDEQLTKALDRKVWLPSGGYLVIDRTEAMTVIDVNTGKFTGSGGNLEETVTRNNLESAEEIVRQLRLRDIGGIIVIDFIDMVLESNRELVLRRLTECLGRDRTRHQVAEVTSLGLVQMTRKRVGTGLLEAYSTTCEHCKGRGLIVASEPQRPGGSGSNGGGGGQQGGGGSRRGRGRGRNNNDDAEPQRTEQQGGPTPEQRESAVTAVAAIAKAAAVKTDDDTDDMDGTGETGERTETAQPETTPAESPSAHPLNGHTRPAESHSEPEVEVEPSQSPSPSPSTEVASEPEQLQVPTPAPRTAGRRPRRAARRPAGPPAAGEETSGD